MKGVYQGDMGSLPSLTTNPCNRVIVYVGIQQHICIPGLNQVAEKRQVSLILYILEIQESVLSDRLDRWEKSLRNMFDTFFMDVIRAHSHKHYFVSHSHPFLAKGSANALYATKHFGIIV
jgi:hypothetical protein